MRNAALSYVPREGRIRLTPLVLAIWVLYVIPSALIFRSSRAHGPYNDATVATMLISVGAVSSHEGINPCVVYLNRSLGRGVLSVLLESPIDPTYWAVAREQDEAAHAV